MATKNSLLNLHMFRFNLSDASLFLSLIILLISLSSCSYEPKIKKIKNTQEILIDKEKTIDDLDFPTHPPSLLKGKEIYKIHCSECHGKSSPGKILDKNYMSSRSPMDQYLAVTRGISDSNGNIIHSFRDSIDRESRWDAVLYMRTEILGYYELNSQELAYMSEIFGANCAVCHGTRGQGDGPLHKSLYPPPANFTQYSRLYTKSDDLLTYEIMHGINWTAMPAWKDRYDYDRDINFNEEMIRKLVRYVRQFGFSQTEDRLDIGRKNMETLTK